MRLYSDTAHSYALISFTFSKQRIMERAADMPYSQIMGLSSGIPTVLCVTPQAHFVKNQTESAHRGTALFRIRAD